MKENVSIVDKRGECSGCSACYNACPYEAIEMILSKEGFYVPEVNKDLCKDCGICLQICPVTNKFNYLQFDHPKTYVAWSLDETKRLSSSSGGIYPEIARFVLEQSGKVFAVGWGKNWLPEHIEVSGIEEISKTVGSKYAQSYVGKVYKRIVDLLRKEKDVLFVGTPCQVAGLKNILLKSVEKQKLNGILTVDLVCHGVASPMVFRKYLTERFGINNITSISFRDKKYGWSKVSFKITMADGILYSKHHLKDPFFYGFLVGLYLNRICYECPFSTLPRQGDITLGDFWGVPEKYKDERGVSVILVNSEKGMSVLNELLKKKRIFAEEVPLEWATKNNPRIITGQMKVPEKREEILKNIHTKNWKYIERKYIKPPTGMRGLIRKGINLFKRILKKTLKIKR